MIENLFLSVGAMKAGTTWLYEQLKNHPDIYFTPQKEIHYFANQVGIDNQLNHRARVEKLKACLNRYHKGNLKYIANHAEEIAWYAEYASNKISNEWYENLFRMNKTRKFCADFSNLYCQMGDNGWDNVHEVAKNVKVIYTLRDPISRLWSHYKFHMKWINQEDDTLAAGFENFKNLLDKHWLWVNAEYAHNYKLLSENVRKEDLLILYFEDFRVDPVKQLGEVQAFLGIQNIVPKTDSLERKVNKTKEIEPPDEWLDYMKNKLSPLCLQMKEVGLWHPMWRNF